MCVLFRLWCMICQIFSFISDILSDAMDLVQGPLETTQSLITPIKIISYRNVIEDMAFITHLLYFLLFNIITGVS